MLLKVGYEISFVSPQPAPMVLMLYLHPTRELTTRKPDRLEVQPPLPVFEYYDLYGNKCGRIVAPAGRVQFRNDALVEDCGLTDLQVPSAPQAAVQDLPNEVLLYLLASRYCEVDSELKDLAWTLFGKTPPGWPRVQAITDFVHRHIRFDYLKARANRTALDVYRERVGVCRDFMHLAITFCRNCNIPARYCTGYLGDIGVPPVPCPMDFSAWSEAYLGGQWYAFDARNNVPRIGRVLMARGRDAADVALTTTFGVNTLQSFKVWTDEVRGTETMHDNGNGDQWYFAYGSNLLAAQMVERTGPIRTGAERPRIARLQNHRVVFNMLGDDGEIYANIEAAAGEVLGVVYRIGPTGLKNLDEFEEGYERRIAHLVLDDGSELEAIAYVSLPENVTEPRQPSAEYFEKIVTGAREHGLPAENYGLITVSAAGPRNSTSS